MSFAPSDLSSIIAHWRSEDIPSGTPDPLNWDDVVSSWRLSASSTAIPAYNSTAIGGLPGLVFDGTNDKLVSTTTKSIGGQISVAIVMRRDLSDYDGLFALATITGNPTAHNTTLFAAYMAVAGNIQYLYRSNGGGITYEGWQPTPSIDTDRLITICTGHTKAFCNVDGGRMPAGVAASATASVEETKTVYAHFGNFVGQMYNGRLSEIVLWNEPSDANHYFWVEGFLAHKYGITLPTWHPFYAAAPTAGPSSGGTARPQHPMFQQVIG